MAICTIFPEPRPFGTGFLPLAADAFRFWRGQHHLIRAGALDAPRLD